MRSVIIYRYTDNSNEKVVNSAKPNNQIDDTISVFFFENVSNVSLHLACIKCDLSKPPGPDLIIINLHNFVFLLYKYINNRKRDQHGLICKFTAFKRYNFQDILSKLLRYDR